jgi:hypothetical protein
MNQCAGKGGEAMRAAAERDTLCANESCQRSSGRNAATSAPSQI